MKKPATAEVVIIGSGPGGGSCAWALTRRGIRVLLLEAGPRFDPATDYRLSSPSWELEHFPHKSGSQGRQTFAPLQMMDPRWRDLRSWNRVTGPYAPGARRRSQPYAHVRGVGGSSLHFTGEAHRLNPQAMSMRSDHGVAADWPLDYQELEPYYQQVEKLIGVSGPSENPSRPRSRAYPLPAHPFSYASQKLAAGAARLAMNWEANPLVAPSKPYAGRPSCNYCGNCYRGCSRMDKGSVDLTFIRAALATGLLDLRPGHRVTRLESDKDNRVSTIHYVDKEGEPKLIDKPNRVIVACGAVETPALLLRSNGLGNDSGLVGRNFMELISWSSLGLHPENLASYRGHPSDSVCWDFNAPDAIPDIIGGCRFSPATAEADLVGPYRYARRVAGGWGLEHKRRMRETFGHVLAVSGIGECLPNARSYIDLDPSETDDLGLPLPRIHSHLDGMAIKRIAFMAKTCRRLLAAAGVTSMIEEYGSYDIFNSAHVFGTCRMGTDPETSVVDSHCRSHTVKNLYVVDASVFPSSGGGESPSLTIEALGVRAVEHMFNA